LVAQLFARTTRSARLTRAGKLFLEHVPRVFTALKQARDSEKAAANGFHSQLRVALSDGISPSRFSTFLALCIECLQAPSSSLWASGRF
jgi:DNA-binding transcriptional LysR family regulator